ncbi:MAG: hypothetical protein OEW73_13930 [Gammaproteobacteria bacterium]|nr:hypothetical protein [Gammaproteobacteria bacterium]MDH5241872.1 hypothetical protein [Gammaproteobacteria bacterium]
MRKINSFLFIFFSLFGLVLLTQSFASDDEVLLEELRASLEKNFNAEMSDLFRAELDGAGLSSVDIDRIIVDLENATTACFLDSLVEHARTHEVALADLINEVDGDKGITPMGFDFEELLNPCLNAARLGAGIAMD